MTNNATIRVFADNVAGRISPYLTGACLEDVNHEVYGGIYSQMLFGESFEEEPMEIGPSFAGLSGTVSCRAERTYLRDEPQVRSWQPFRRGSAKGEFQHTILQARRGRYSQKIALTAGAGEVGIENQGLNRWGLHLMASKPYEGLVVLLAEEDTEVTVALESRDGAQVYAEAALHVPGDKAWHDLSFELLPNASDPAGRFAIKLKAPGAVWVDYALLEPGPWGRFAGLPVRKGIADALVAQGLTVLRYGGYMINTDWGNESRCPGSGYRWKNMIGPRQERPPYFGTFYPYSSNGFGIIDFVNLCRAAGFLCIPTINPSERPEDVADLVEYLNGDCDTPWGARRAADGHPEPYRLRYLQIGNEERMAGGEDRWLVRSDYPELFASLAEAVRAKDPTITLIASPWLYYEKELDYPENRDIVKRLLAAGKGHETLWDIHVLGDQLHDADVMERFFPRLRAYINEIDPENQVRFCILEENGVQHNLQRALGHAHNINTVERLDGEVLIDTPANCLQAWQQNDNFWDQGQVFFTPGTVWGMPPYYAQQMIARHYQPLRVAADVQGAGDALDVTATRSEDGRTVVVKVVNLEGQGCRALVIPGICGEAGQVGISCLAGPLEGANSPSEPCRIIPTESKEGWGGESFEHVFPGHSFTILRFEAGCGR